MEAVARLRWVAVVVVLSSCAPPEVETSRQALAGSMKLGVIGDHFVRTDGTPVWLLGMATCCDESPDPALDNGWPWITPHYLDEVAAHGGNWVTLRTGPAHRDGEGVDFEGYRYQDGRYDLSTFDAGYFARLHDRIAYARALGVYVEVDLIDTWYLERGNPSPWKRGSNLQDLELACRAPSGECSGLLDRAPDATQLAWVGQVIDATGDLDNVIYQLANEPYDCDHCGTSAVWQQGLLDFARARLAANGMPAHPFGTNVDDGAAPVDADYVDLHRSVAVALAGSKPTGVNEGGTELGLDFPLDGAQYSDTVWRGFVNRTFFHYWWGAPYDGARVDAVLARMQAFRRVLDHVAWADFTPAGDLDGNWLVTGDGAQWLGYWAGGGADGVDLAIGGGHVTYTWYDVATGVAIDGGEADAGAMLTLDPPDAPAVVHVVRGEAVDDGDDDVCDLDGACEEDAGETADTCADCVPSFCKPAPQSFTVSWPRVATYGVTFTADLAAITPGSTPLWDLGTGDHRAGSPITVTYQAAGTYHVVLTTNDVRCGTTVLTEDDITIDGPAPVSCGELAAQQGWIFQGCGDFGGASCDNLPGTSAIGTGWDCVLSACCAAPPPPELPTCGAMGGDYCHDVAGTCPWPFTPIGPSRDCPSCCDAPSGPSCGAIGGDECRPLGQCPSGYTDLGSTWDCGSCCDEVPAPCWTYDTCYESICDDHEVWVDDYCTGTYYTNDWCDECWTDCHLEDYDNWVCDDVCGTVPCNYEAHDYQYVCGGHWEYTSECHDEPYDCNPHPC